MPRFTSDKNKIFRQVCAGITVPYSTCENLILSGSLDIYSIEFILLTDFGDFDFGEFLAMASFFMNALFGFIADNADFIAFYFGRFNFS